jgi:hypothetical protein
MALLSQGAAFSFKGTQYTVTSVTVESPHPEIVDMTSKVDSNSRNAMVWTGAYSSPGRIVIDGLGFSDPKSLAGSSGYASFSTSGGSVSVRCVCDSASVEAKVGELLRVRISLTTTDYSE